LSNNLAEPLTYPHIVALWTLVQHNPVEKLRELRGLLRQLWNDPSRDGVSPKVSDIPEELRRYLTQAVSFKTLRSVYGDSMVKQMESGEIALPEDMLIPDAVIVGRVRPAFDADEFKDHLVLGKAPSTPRVLVRRSSWQEGQSVEDAEQAFMDTCDSLQKEFRSLSDNQAHAAGQDTSLITYVYRKLMAEPLPSGRAGFQVSMEFRQVTRLGTLTARDIDGYEVVSERGEYPTEIPNRMVLMTLMKEASEIKLHNPFRDDQGRHVIPVAKTRRTGPVLLDVSEDK